MASKVDISKYITKAALVVGDQKVGYRFNIPRIGCVIPFEIDTFELNSVYMDFFLDKFSQDCHQKCHICQCVFHLLTDSKSILVDASYEDLDKPPVYSCGKCSDQSPSSQSEYVKVINAHLFFLRQDPLDYNKVFSRNIWELKIPEEHTDNNSNNNNNAIDINNTDIIKKEDDNNIDK